MKIYSLETTLWLSLRVYVVKLSMIPSPLDGVVFRGLKFTMVVKVTGNRKRSVDGRVFKILAAAIIVAGCQGSIDVRGNLPDPDLLQDIEIGYITKDEVVELLGSPSSISPFSGDTWYYISERTKTVAFFEPKILNRKVIMIIFDQKGVARELKSYGIEDARRIQMVERKTPTAGRELTILKQLFGNIGRFEGASEEN